MIDHYHAKSVLDPFSGGGTTKDVCAELKIPCDTFDLKDGFDSLTDALPAKKYSMIFLHPPYFSMIKYSDDSRDLSNAPTIQEFMQRLSTSVMRFSEYLEEGGHIVVLIGNMRKNGRYYPLGAYLATTFHREIKEELIKIQHNVTSSGKEYSNYNFIPIMHEHVLVLADFPKLTWNELVLRALEELGGAAELKELYRKLQSHPKTLTNPTYKATIRRTLQEEASQVDLGIWTSEKT